MATTSKQDLASLLNWSEMSASDHLVQFYKTDEFLLDSLNAFIATGLVRGDICIIIATKTHREGLDERLKANGLDLATVHAQGRYIVLDAVETLPELMVDGLLAPERFVEIVGSVVAHAAKSGRHVRIFGELVALLWTEGNQTAAIQLEDLWNELCDKTRAFSLFCAYSMHSFAGDVYTEQFTEICHQHSRIIPDESYSMLDSPDERLRAVTLLQQKASSLQAEIAERKIAEERLRISENRYRRLFEASKDGILIVDPYTCAITDVNPGFIELLGTTREKVLDQQLWQIGLFEHQEACLEAMQDIQEKGFTRHEALPLQTSDGQQRYVEFLSTLYRESDHDVIQCNLRDITERKRAEDEQKQLEERKNAFISMASHELKTPITSLKGFTQILQRRLKAQSDAQTQLFLDRMDTQLKKLTVLISDLLDVSKMQTGILAFREAHIDLDELVREIVENVQAATTTHQLRLQGETRAFIYGDRDRLEQVLINLLTNAIKYSPQADTVIVHLSKKRERVEVAVQDFGIGIAIEYHEGIFERFYQVNDPQENTYPGLGIGLYIARTLVERHGGRLWLESRKGAGSTFYFTLPLLSEQQDVSHLLSME